MRRLLALSCLAATACFNFDGAYDQYCMRANCRGDGGTGGGAVTGGGTSAGGSAAGGSTAGGSTAGGSTAGGSTAGGSTAGGSTAGGSTAGGSTAGGTAGGMVVDAGLQCVGTPFCLYRSTARTDVKIADAVVGDSLTETYGFFSRTSPTASVQFVEHNGTATGLIRPMPLAVPFIKIFGGSARDFFVISNSNMTTAPIIRFVDGGVSATVFRSTNGCAGQNWFANSYAIDRIQNRLVVGGRNEGLCSVDLASPTFASTVLQPDTMASPIQYVERVYAAPGGSVYYGTDDGYVGKLGVGRISGQLDPDGIVGIDGTSETNVWILTSQCRVAVPDDDGGVSVIADLNGLSTRCYGMKVTEEGVFIGAFEAILHRTRFTDGGFESFQNLPVGTFARFYNISGGPGAIHIVGDDGPASTPTQAYYLSLIPRTQ